MINPELEKLVETAFSDGKITDREIEILTKKAEHYGVDLDEFELYLENKIELFNKNKKFNVKISNSAKKIFENPLIPIMAVLLLLGGVFIILAKTGLFSSNSENTSNNNENKTIVNKVQVSVTKS